jgi:hypothetical protein
METMDPMDSSGLMAVMGTLFLFYGIFMLFFMVCLWKIFSKAGKPGWAAIIPIYNLIVWLEIVNKPLWWIILMLIPIVNFFVLIVLTHQLSLAFGQGVGMTIMLLFFIGYPILAFGSAQYQGQVRLATQPV